MAHVLHVHVYTFAIAFDMASCSRKRSVVTLEKKLEVIALLKDGKSQRSVSAIYACTFTA